MRRPAPYLVALVALSALLFAPLRTLAQGTIHLVEAGDTLSALSLRYDTTIDELRDLNDLESDRLRIGQRLVLPPPKGWTRMPAPLDVDWAGLGRAWGMPAELLRTVNPDVDDPAGAMLRVPPGVGPVAAPRDGEDLISFAARLGASPGTIATLNGLTSPYRIEAGLPLLIPSGAALDPDAGSNAGSNAARDRSEEDPLTPSSGAAGTSASVATDPAPAAPAGGVGPALSPRSHQDLRADAFGLLGSVLAGVRLEPPDDGFSWPLMGSPRLTSLFGWRALSVAGNRYHLGLDLASPIGTPVHAARDGVVVRAGWIGAYGYVVYLRHGDGFETRYAHLSRIDVVEGDSVRRGQPIGRVGSTGASTGPHLHFEVRLDGRALDPLGVLPAGPARASTAN